MTPLQALVLGIVQGLTEFLPVSSSGHLVLVPALLGWEFPADQAFVFDVLVQVGTLAAVFVYFWPDLSNIARGMLRGLRSGRPFADADARLGWLLLLATVPAGAAGLLVKPQVEAAFSSSRATSLLLLVTALLLVFAERASGNGRRAESLGWKDALIIGGFQIMAIFPGVSRSGSTIAGGMAQGLSRAESARFSFLMAIPVMLAAGLLSLLDLKDVAGLDAFLPSLATGFAAAAVSGYLAIRWLVGYLKSHRLYGFAVYVAALSVVSLLLT